MGGSDVRGEVGPASSTPPDSAGQFGLSIKMEARWNRLRAGAMLGR